MGGFPDYRRRRVSFIGMEEFGAWSVKVYTIDADGPMRPAEALGAARERVPDLLPESLDGGRAPAERVGGAPPGAAGEHVHGEAFVIVHAGEDAVWLLVFWWSDACLLHRRVVAASFERPTRFDVVAPGTLVGCTWELAIAQHERDAWVRHVQGRGEAADLEAYRADVLDGVDV